MELKDWIDLFGAVSSVVVALGTGLLAWATFRLANFTKATVADAEEGLKQADRHHQENLRPFCQIEFDQTRPNAPFGVWFPPLRPSVGPDVRFPGRHHLSIVGKLHNSGLGPAKDIVVYLNRGSSINGHPHRLSHSVAVSGIIGAGEEYHINVKIAPESLTQHMADGGPIPFEVLEQVGQDAYEVVLHYRDVFDNIFRTVHAKGFLTDPRTVGKAGVLETSPTLRRDRPTPVFLKGEECNQVN